MDDTFSLFDNKDTASTSRFLDFLNSSHPNIKTTRLMSSRMMSLAFFENEYNLHEMYDNSVKLFLLIAAVLYNNVSLFISQISSHGSELQVHRVHLIQFKKDIQDHLKAFVLKTRNLFSSPIFNLQVSQPYARIALSLSFVDRWG